MAHKEIRSTSKRSEARLFSRDAVRLAALDKLASTIVAVMVLFAVMNMTVFLILGKLALGTHIANNHRLLLTSVS
jgi:hypothetical protein